MKKIYILDTNVLLQSPMSLFSFEDNDVVLPDIVLEELDNHKNDNNEVGYNARCVIRSLDDLRQIGSLVDGVKLQNGGTFRIETNHIKTELVSSWDSSKADNRILRVAKGITDDYKRDPEYEVVLVSKDVNVRIKADIIGVKAEDYLTEAIADENKQYKGRREMYITSDEINAFYRDGLIPKENADLTVNEYILMICDSDTKQTALGRFDGKNIVKLHYSNHRPSGVRPRNVGQNFMQEALMMSAEEAPLVIIKGAAGTAKTFYSLAVGLSKVMETDREYRKILITRPNVTFDNDIGFLPGSEKDKIGPLLRFANDNLETLLAGENKLDETEDMVSDRVAEIFERGYVTAEALNFMRGRSITQNYIIVDEAQNLTPHMARSIITRAGVGTKIILLGDPEQIDNPKLTKRNNGLVYAIEKMQGDPQCHILTLEDSECTRSKLAVSAGERMRAKGL